MLQGAETKAAVENCWRVLHKETDKVSRTEPKAKANSNNSPRGRSGNEIEMVSDSSLQILFGRCQNRCREQSSDASAIERKNLESWQFVAHSALGELKCIVDLHAYGHAAC